jgi:hypothetical protein
MTEKIQNSPTVDDIWVSAFLPPKERTETLIIIAMDGSFYTDYGIYDPDKKQWYTNEGEEIGTNYKESVVAWMRRKFPKWINELLKNSEE